jgi:hypothetical protein
MNDRQKHFPRWFIPLAGVMGFFICVAAGILVYLEHVYPPLMTDELLVRKVLDSPGHFRMVFNLSRHDTVGVNMTWDNDAWVFVNELCSRDPAGGKLIPLLTSANPGVVAGTLNWMLYSANESVKTPDDKAMAGIIRDLKLTAHADLRVRWLAYEFLQEHTDLATVDELRSALTDSEAAIRRSAAGYLSHAVNQRVGDEAWQRELALMMLDMITSPDPAVRERTWNMMYASFISAMPESLDDEFGAMTIPRPPADRLVETQRAIRDFYSRHREQLNFKGAMR